MTPTHSGLLDNLMYAQTIDNLAPSRQIMISHLTVLLKEFLMMSPHFDILILQIQRKVLRWSGSVKLSYYLTIKDDQYHDVEHSIGKLHQITYCRLHLAIADTCDDLQRDYLLKMKSSYSFGRTTEHAVSLGNRESNLRGNSEGMNWWNIFG